MKTLKICIAVLLVLQAWTSPALSAQAQERGVAVEPNGRQKWAFVFGSDSYYNERHFSTLSHCGDDLEGVEAILANRAGFNQIFVYHDKQPTVDKLPMRLIIKQAFEAFVSLPEPQDQVIVVGSLHGMEVDGIPYLCPMDADPEKPAATMLKVSWLYETLDLHCKATQKIVILDACRRPARGQIRAAGLRAMPPGLGGSIRAAPASLLVLSSCISGQVSYEAPELHHGVFINFILRGLSGKADSRQLSPRGNGDGQVDVDELFAYAAKETSAYVVSNFRARQTPEKYGREIFPPIVLTGQPVRPGPIPPEMTIRFEGADTVDQAERLTRVAVAKSEAGESAMSQMALSAALTLINDMPQEQETVKEWVIVEIAKAFAATKDFDGALNIAEMVKDERRIRTVLGHIVQAQVDAQEFSRAVSTAKLMAPPAPTKLPKPPKKRQHGRYEGAVPMANAFQSIAEAAADAGEYSAAEQAISALHYYSPSYGYGDHHTWWGREDYGEDDHYDGKSESADGDEVRAIEKATVNYVDSKKTEKTEPKGPGKS